MGGPTAAQEQLQQAQSAFYTQMTQEYSTIFGESQGILSALTKSFEPILAAGPNQQGFSQAELNSLNSSAVTQTGQNFQQAEKAISNQEQTAGGGGAYIPSGSTTQLEEAVGSSAAATESEEETQIVQADYNQGLQNYWNASSELGSVAGQLNPAGFATATTGAGSAASNTAQEIAQESGSWMSLVGSAMGATGTAFEGKCWIASRIFGGWYEPRTVLVRSWLFTTFNQTWYGKAITKLYEKFGERISRSDWLVKLLTPLFKRALREALSI